MPNAYLIIDGSDYTTNFDTSTNTLTVELTDQLLTGAKFGIASTKTDAEAGTFLDTGTTDENSLISFTSRAEIFILGSKATFGKSLSIYQEF